MESGIYFGWAGLSTSKATTAHPPGAATTYKHMAAQAYQNMNELFFGKEGQSDQEQGGAVYPMVMSIGFNPVYENKVRSVEVHVMHDFDIDFYETHMNLVILGFIRPEYDYESKDKLIDDIETDIDVAGQSLARAAYASYARDPYLLEFSGRSEVAS